VDLSSRQMLTKSQILLFETVLLLYKWSHFIGSLAHYKIRLVKFTNVSQPINLGCPVACLASVDILLFDTFTDVVSDSYHV
jgi:hypothetical protein